MEVYRQGPAALIVEPRLCKGCALCVNSCPVGILALNGLGKVQVLEVGRCVFCGLCEVRCPDFAIAMRKPRIVRRPA